MWRFIGGVVVGAFAGGFLTQQVISTQVPPPPARVDAEFELLRARIAELEARRIDTNQQLDQLRAQALEVRELCGPRDH